MERQETDMQVQAEGKELGSAAKSAFEWAEDLVIAIVLVATIFTFFLRIITVDGSSMNPNYTDGNRVLVSGWVTDVKQGDVVIVTNIKTLDGPIIKRVLATEGQTVDFDAEKKAVVVDGVAVDDSRYGVENGITEINWSNYEMLTFPATVPAGCVFVLGDNRPISKDSRYQEIGMIDKRNILGKAMLKIYPFEQFSPAH